MYQRINPGNLKSEEISGRSNAYDQVKKVGEAFKTMVFMGEVTPTDIVNHVLTIDNAGYETIPTSIGMAWIIQNPDEFKSVVGDVDAFVLDLAVILMEADSLDKNNPMTRAALQLRHWFFPRFICSWRTMRLLSPAMRERFVREFYPIWGANNNLWISAALQLGVTRQTIAEAILNNLRETVVQRGMANDVDDFLEYGAGYRPGNENPVKMTMRRLLVTITNEMLETLDHDPIPGIEAIELIVKNLETVIARGETWNTAFNPPWLIPTDDHSPEAMWSYCFAEITPWWALSTAELVSAMTICAGKLPGKTIAALEFVAMSRGITQEDQVKILHAATSVMTSLDGVSVDTLSKRLLPLQDRVALARRLEAPAASYHWIVKPTAQFLFRIVCDLPREEREAFWVEVVEPKFHDASPSTLYCAWRQLELEERDIEVTLRQWFYETGYVMGTIIQGRHPKGGTQWQVELDGHRFVQSRDQHRYFPKAGDEVIFLPRCGTFLTPNVTAVTFVPVMQDVQN